ncbi:alkaline phosphatase family protein, partial [Vibrio parahaemolyticus]|nr:alkaline phosphatase family protein [Vibrio parahaemolyticus]
MPALMNTTEISSLPLVVAGPILRKVTATEINIWLVTTQRLEGMVQITDENASILYQAPLSEQKEQLQIGLNAWCCLLKLEG